LNGVLKWRLECIHRQFEAFGALAGLEADGFFVVVAADGAATADEDEPAFGLRLEDPRVGEGAPPRFEFGEAAGVAGDGDAVLVHLEAGRVIDDGGDFDRRFAVFL